MDLLNKDLLNKVALGLSIYGFMNVINTGIGGKVLNPTSWFNQIMLYLVIFSTAYTRLNSLVAASIVVVIFYILLIVFHFIPNGNDNSSPAPVESGSEESGSADSAADSDDCGDDCDDE
jgi:hypothetical protein